MHFQLIFSTINLLSTGINKRWRFCRHFWIWQCHVVARRPIRHFSPVKLLLTSVTMLTRWSRSTSNFYALIGQNLTREFMRNVFVASWILFTLTAEADKVLCQLVMFLTVFFHWIEIQLLSAVFCYSWLVSLLGFWLRNTSLVKVENPISDGIIFVFTLLDA